ncbi:site-specific DNA recombinase [Streptomyces sp. V1I1]|nr:site-specific DNA recombinase [Streptomyces sp. V1I1]
MDDLKRGVTPNGERVDGLIVYDIDRLARDNRHLEDAIEVVQNFGRPIIDITGSLDLLADKGRTVARIVTATNNKQSADTARRVARKHQALQQAGIPTGGRRPFGWKEDKRTLDPYESKWLRQMVHWLLAGKPISAVIHALKKAGVSTASGHEWSREAIKVVMRNPRMCGYRSRQVIDVDPVTGMENKRLEIVLDDKGKPVMGQWKPVTSVDEWEAVIELLGSNPAPGSAPQHSQVPVARHAPLRPRRVRSPLAGDQGSKEPQQARGVLLLHVPEPRQCPSRVRRNEDRESGDGQGSFHDGDRQAPREAAQRKATPEPAQWDKEGELARVNEDIEDLKQARKSRVITAETYFSQLAEHGAEKRRLASERNRALRNKHTSKSRPVNLAEEWEDFTLTEQRAYVEDLLIAVLVSPAVGRGRPVRDRLAPIWRPKGDLGQEGDGVPSDSA